MRVNVKKLRSNGDLRKAKLIRTEYGVEFYEYLHTIEVELKDANGNVKQYTFKLLIYFYKGDVENYHELKVKNEKANATASNGDGGNFQ